MAHSLGRQQQLGEGLGVGSHGTARAPSPLDTQGRAQISAAHASGLPWGLSLRVENVTVLLRRSHVTLYRALLCEGKGS